MNKALSRGSICPIIIIGRMFFSSSLTSGRMHFLRRDYTAEFDHSMMCCGIVEPEEQMVARYLGGVAFRSQQRGSLITLLELQ